jgi:hypothetical protein
MYACVVKLPKRKCNLTFYPYNKEDGPNSNVSDFVWGVLSSYIGWQTNYTGIPQFFQAYASEISQIMVQLPSSFLLVYYSLIILPIFTIWPEFLMISSSLVVKALCYKLEGRGFDNRWGDFINLPNPSGRTRPWGLLSL